jgi:hypothetical protein
MFTPRTKIIGQVLAVHLGFHTLWVLVFLVSLLGVFILIPFTGLYNAFVLGFMGKSVWVSPVNAAILGYLAFSLTGLLSGWFISLFHPKSVWLFAFCSVFATCVLFVTVSAVRYTAFGAPGLESILPLPATTGRADVDKFEWALKAQSVGEVPPYFSGKPAVVPFSEVQPALRLLPKDFQLEGGPYTYCKLSPEVWKGLRADAPKKYPVLWSDHPDTSGKRLVVSVDLGTDVYHDEFVTEQALSERLGALEAATGRLSGDANFKLR